MNELQLFVMIAVFGISVAITRFLPFLVFRNAEKLPRAIDYLGRVLPAAMMGLLVVYCMKDYNFADISEIIPLAISVVAVVALQLWKHKTILSISVGTVLYMLLIRADVILSHISVF